MATDRKTQVRKKPDSVLRRALKDTVFTLWPLLMIPVMHVVSNDPLWPLHEPYAQGNPTLAKPAVTMSPKTAKLAAQIRQQDVRHKGARPTLFP